MSNELYFHSIKDNYENLKSFSINKNTLYFKDNKTFMLILSHLTLANINPKLFLLEPREIYRVLYLLELLPHKDINENDKKFINEYVKKYLESEEKKLSNEEIEHYLVDSLGMPIYYSDDPALANTPTSLEIHKILDEHRKEIEGGKNMGPKLVLTNSNFDLIPEETPIIDATKAGFATILLIAGTVVATCIYIAIFIAS